MAFMRKIAATLIGFVIPLAIAAAAIAQSPNVLIKGAANFGTTSLSGPLVIAGPVGGPQVAWVCGFDLSYIGGSGTLGPVSLQGLAIGTFFYEGASLGNAPFSRTFTPCLPATVATSITLNVTANATATSVAGQIWGFWQ
jgi:hypothetical protein